MSICQLKCTSRCTVVELRGYLIYHLNCKQGFLAFLLLRATCISISEVNLCASAQCGKEAPGQNSIKLLLNFYFLHQALFQSSDKQSDHGYLKVVLEVKCSLLLMLDPCLSLPDVSALFFLFVFQSEALNTQLTEQLVCLNQGLHPGCPPSALNCSRLRINFQLSAVVKLS